MLLAIDIGNSNIKLGIFDADREGGETAPVIALNDSATPAEVPVEAEPVLFGSAFVDGANEGPVILSNGAPVQMVRYTLVDQMQWSNRASGVQYRVVIPRQEIRPVSLTTY